MTNTHKQSSNSTRKAGKPMQPEAAKPTRGFIDAALMERAVALRGEGKTMKEIGTALNVRSTGYLAAKIKEHYGADALARSAKATAEPKAKTSAS
jgi:hypothetical protein